MYRSYRLDNWGKWWVSNEYSNGASFRSDNNTRIMKKSKKNLKRRFTVWCEICEKRVYMHYTYKGAIIHQRDDVPPNMIYAMSKEVKWKKQDEL